MSEIKFILSLQPEIKTFKMLNYNSIIRDFL